MDALFSYICQNAEYAHYIFFGLLMLAGLNIPISEDFLLLTGGAIVSRCIPDQYLHLYLWIFFGCWISGFEAYWLGRRFGPKLYQIRWFKKIVTPERISKLHTYYEKYGIFTFILGRFIPGGVRNTLFITSGMGKMPFLRFAARDFIACFISTNVLFYLGFFFGERYEEIRDLVLYYDKWVLGLFVSILLAAGLRIVVKPPEKSAGNLP